MISYPSKLLLLGEYTVIKEGTALAIPYPTYQGSWSFLAPNSIDAIKSRASLINIVDYLKKNKSTLLDLKKLADDLQNGLWFQSSIPRGYGLGSSGAVCAALYQKYNSHPAQKLSILKKELASLENCFHGQSSGIDPLVTYTNTALKIKENKTIVCVPIPKSQAKGAIFLLDTHQDREATPLIQSFLLSAQKTSFQQQFIIPSKVAVSLAINALVNQERSSLLSQIEKISSLQYQHLPQLIMPNVRTLWLEGLQTKDFFLKICGAGGGGFLLGFTLDWEATQSKYLKDYSVEFVFNI